MAPNAYAIAAAVLSLVVIYLGAAAPAMAVHALAAAGFAAAVLIVAAVIAMRYPADGRLETAARSAHRYALLMATTYAWASGAMIVTYDLTDLRWYHTHQYAVYFAVPAIMTVLFARMLRRSAMRPSLSALRLGRRLTLAQLVLTGGGAAYMLFAGSAQVTSSNQAGLHILLACLLSTALVSVVALRAQGDLEALNTTAQG